MCERECGDHPTHYDTHAICRETKGKESVCLNSYQLGGIDRSRGCMLAPQVGLGWQCAPAKWIMKNNLKQCSHCPVSTTYTSGDTYAQDPCPYNAESDPDSDAQKMLSK